MDNSEMARALQAVIEDVSLPAHVRHQACERLAQLLPSAHDQALQFVSLLPTETVELLADWPEPE